MAAATETVIGQAPQAPALLPQTERVGPSSLGGDEPTVAPAFQYSRSPSTQPRQDEPTPNYPASPIELIDRFIDEPRPLRVAVIGGGLSGILAGILLPAKVPRVKLTIYEKNKDFVRRRAGYRRTTSERGTKGERG